MSRFKWPNSERVFPEVAIQHRTVFARPGSSQDQPDDLPSQSGLPSDLTSNLTP